MPEKMKIAVVTTYPPGKGSLNEYAYHFVRFLRRKSEVGEVVLLTDKLPQGQEYPTPNTHTGTLHSESLAPLQIVPCWRFGALYTLPSILAAIRQHKPDVVLFNLQFATFGAAKVPATLGLLAPALTHAQGYPTVVLLHNLMETVDLKSAGFSQRLEGLIRFFGTVVTRLLLTVDLVALTIPKYVEILEEKYHVKNVLLLPHGAFEEFSLPEEEGTSDTQVIMTFGKFGTYKRVEPLLDAFRLLRTGNRTNLELVIAGTDSPNAPGYLAEMQQRFADVPDVHFTGYVPEEDVPGIFKRSTVVAFPYASTTGSSGVLHQAGEYGKAVVLPNIGDFAEVITEEGFTGKFFEPDDVLGLANALASLLDDPEARRTMGRQNALASRGLPINEVVDWYLVHFEGLLADKSTHQKKDSYHAYRSFAGR